MCKVETQSFVVNHRTFLLDVSSENRTQSIVQKVGCCVVVGDFGTACSVNNDFKIAVDVLRHFLGNVDAQVVFFYCINNRYALFTVNDYALVANLTAFFGVERCAVEDNVVQSFVFLYDLAVAKYACVFAEAVVAGKFAVGFIDDYPVVGVDLGGVAGAFLLLCHFGVEIGLIYGVSLFASDEFGKVERESVGVVQQECLNTRNFGLAFRFQLVHFGVEQTQTAFERAQEYGFFLVDDLFDQSLLRNEFGERVAHKVNQSIYQLVHERRLDVEEGVCVADGAAQDSADYIACLVVRWQLTVGNSERNCSQMVGNYAQSDVGFVVHAIFFARNL